MRTSRDRFQPVDTVRVSAVLIVARLAYLQAKASNGRAAAIAQLQLVRQSVAEERDEAQRERSTEPHQIGCNERKLALS